MHTGMKNPQLRRDIQPVSVRMGNQLMITFVDPLQLSQRSPAIARDVIPVLEMLDGTHDLRDIQMGMMRLTRGELIPISTIESFVEQLDQAFLLESDRFHERKTALIEQFEMDPVRRPSHAGSSYDADPIKLKEFIEDTEAGLPEPDTDIHLTNIAGIIAPHIDVSVAKSEYVDVYRRLKGRHYDCVIILGVNHQGVDGLYCVSDKTYLTPLGEMAADKEFVSELKKRVAKGALASSDFDHKTEHSIEFQTIFLRHYLDGDFKIVPILCGSVHEFVLGGKTIFKDERFISMVQALNELIAMYRGSVLVVAGVDFSHIGHKFGHRMPARDLLTRAQDNDEIIFTHLKNIDPEKIFEHANETKDFYNVCGLPSLLVFSSLMKGCQAELLVHKAYDEHATLSAVTYASMVFARP